MSSKKPSRRRALRITVWSVVGLLLAGIIGLGYLYFRLDHNLKGVDIDAALGDDRPRESTDGSLNFLVLGSDSRAGDNGRYGHDGGGARSDTAMVVHVHKGHRKASIVSIPRDTLVDRPACPYNSGGTAPGARRVMFNEAYAIGGPACAVKTVESMSGIRMDHFFEVDFTGFEQLVDQLGGVEMTVKQALKDRESGLDVQAGPQTLDGRTSLALVRTRHAVGDGSDLGRIQLQQGFVRALVQQTHAIDLFGNPVRLYGLADTATQSLTTDSELASVDKLLGFSRSLKNLRAPDLHLVTLPVSRDTIDPNRVVAIPGQARQLWEALRADQEIPASVTQNSAGEESRAKDLID